MTDYPMTLLLLLLCCGGATIFRTVNGEHDYVNKPPIWQDYLDIEALIAKKVDESSCPPEEVLMRGEHWDWDGSSTDCTLFPRARGGRSPLGPMLVQLAFHDAAGEMDGFVDLSEDTGLENRGLKAAVVVLDKMHESDVLSSSISGDKRPISDVVSRADLYSWAGIAAVRISSGRQNPELQPVHIPHIPVRYGRETYVADPSNPNDHGPEEQFPVNGASSTFSETVEYFESKFGFNSFDTAAIMGVHTLGGAHKLISGYEGTWTVNTDTFDEGFYSQLVNPTPLVNCTFGGNGQNPEKMVCENLEETGQCDSLGGGRCFGWEQAPVHGPLVLRYEWRQTCDANGDGCTGLMLNVDMALYRSIDRHVCGNNDVFPDTGKPCFVGQIKSFPQGSPCVFGTSRVFATCFEPSAVEARIVDIWANPFNRNPWIDDFAAAFDVMMTRTIAPGIAVTEILPTDATATSPLTGERSSGSTTEPPPTDAPTASEDCIDDADWTIVTAQGVEKDCDWVADNPNHHCNKIGENGIISSVACPDACGKCSS